jgi:hypothetical protein
LSKKILLFFTSLRKSPSPEFSENLAALHPLSAESDALIQILIRLKANGGHTPVRRQPGFGTQGSRTTKGGSLNGLDQIFLLQSRMLFARNHTVGL